MKKVNFKEINVALKRGCKFVSNWVVAHKPELYLGGAALAGVGCAVSAYKAHDAFWDAKLDYISDEMDIYDLIDDGVITEADGRKRMVKLYIKTGLNYVKVWAPTVALGATSGYLGYKSYKIMKTSIKNLTVENAKNLAEYANYRNNVVKTFGEDVDKELLSGAIGGVIKEFEHTVKDEATGEEKKVTEKALVVDPNNLPAATFLFNKNISAASENNFEYDYFYCKQLVAALNDRLIANTEGKVSVHDVQMDLGIPRSNEYNGWGWIWPYSQSVRVELKKVYIGDENKPYDSRFWRVLVKITPDYIDIWSKKPVPIKEMVGKNGK